MKEKIRKWIGKDKIKSWVKNAVKPNFKVFALTFLVLLAIALSFPRKINDKIESKLGRHKNKIMLIILFAFVTVVLATTDITENLITTPSSIITDLNISETANISGHTFNSTTVTINGDLLIHQDLLGVLDVLGGDLILGQSNLSTTGYYGPVNDVLYVIPGNGSDIQTKIDSCTGGGCHIYVSGINLINQTILLNKNSVVLEGLSTGGGKYTTYPSTVIQADSGFDAGTNIINLSGEGSGIRNMYFNGSNYSNVGVAIQSGTEFLDYVHVVEQRGSGIVIEPLADSENTLNNVWSGLNGLHGLEINRGDVRVNGFTAYRNWYGSAIYMSSGSNQISNTHSFYNYYGIYFNGSDTSVVTNNVFDQNEMNAIYFDSSRSQINGNTIIGNTFFSNSWKGGVGGACDNSTPLFFFDDASGNGIKEITVVGNTFDSCTSVLDYNSDNNIDRIFFGFNTYPEGVISLGNVSSKMQVFDTSHTSPSLVTELFNVNLDLNGGTITNTSSITNTGTASLNYTILGDGVNNSDMLYFDTERDWKIRAGGTAGVSSLDFVSMTDAKEFRIMVSTSGANISFKTAPSDTGHQLTTVYDMLVIPSNITSVSCSAATKTGGVYRDSGTSQFYVCNGTLFNQLVEAQIPFGGAGYACFDSDGRLYSNATGC